MGAWLSAIVLVFKVVLEAIPLLNKYIETNREKDALKAKQDKDTRNDDAVEKANSDSSGNPS